MGSSGFHNVRDFFSDAGDCVDQYTFSNNKDGSKEITMDRDAPQITDDMMFSFTLYHYHGERNSITAVTQARGNSVFSKKTQFVDLATVEEIPDFLSGVPTLFVKKDGKIYEGTECMEQIQTQIATLTKGAAAWMSGKKKSTLKFSVPSKQAVAGTLTEDDTRHLFSST